MPTEAERTVGGGGEEQGQEQQQKPQSSPSSSTMRTAMPVCGNGAVGRKPRDHQHHRRFGMNNIVINGGCIGMVSIASEHFHGLQSENLDRRHPPRRRRRHRPHPARRIRQQHIAANAITITTYFPTDLVSTAIVLSWHRLLPSGLGARTSGIMAPSSGELHLS